MKSHIQGVEAFTLDFQVQFPLSLVLNKKILTKYQLIFRHLFQCKYVERLLMGSWLDHAKLRQSARGASYTQSAQCTSLQDDVSFMGRMSSLSAKMLHFVQQFMYYMFVEVIEPNWEKMEKDMAHVSFFD